MEGLDLQPAESRLMKYYHKFEKWAKAHPYLAGLTIAIIGGALWYLIGKLSSAASTSASPGMATNATGSAGSSGTANGSSFSVPQNASSYSNNELVAAQQAAIADLANQTAAAREAIKQQILNSGVAQSATAGSGLAGVLSKISSGSLDKVFDAILGKSPTGQQPAGTLLQNVLGGTIIPGQSGTVDAAGNPANASLASYFGSATDLTLATNTIYNPDGITSVNNNSYIPSASAVQQQTDYSQWNFQQYNLDPTAELYGNQNASPTTGVYPDFSFDYTNTNPQPDFTVDYSGWTGPVNNDVGFSYDWGGGYDNYSW